MSIPQAARLLPIEHSTELKNRPPIYVKLTADVLEALKNGTPAKLKLQLDGSSAKLSWGRSVVSGSLTAEPGTLGVYVPDKTSENYRSAGQVSQRLVLRDESGRTKPTVGSLVTGKHARPSTPSLGTASAVSSPSLGPQSSFTGSSVGSSSGSGKSRASTSPRRTASVTPPPETTERIMHMLAIGATSAADLGKSIGTATDDVRTVFNSIAVPVQSGKISVNDPFVLADDHYRNLRIWDWNYSDDERKSVIDSASRAYGRLGLPSDDPARLRLLRPKARLGAKAKLSSRDRLSPPYTESQSQPHPHPNGALKEHPGRPRPMSAAAVMTSGPKVNGNGERVAYSSPTIGSTNVEAPSSKKRRVSDSGDMFELAKKFRTTYSEYAKLYGLLAGRRSRPPAQVQQLLSMHKDLEVWKKRLWSSTGAKKRVKPRSEMPV